MIVITTPTGAIGSAVTESLYRHHPVRLIARDPSRIADDIRSHVDVVAGSHARSEVLDAALPDARALFVLVPPDFGAADVTEQYLGFARPIAEAVRAHGVHQVVAISSLGRGYDRPAGQLSAAWAMDDVLESSGAAYRSIQPPFFMENLARQAALIRSNGEFALTADPDEPHPTVAVADVVAAAVDLLADPTWSGQRGVAVSSPVDHTPREMAEIMSEELGRPITYRQVAIDDYRSQLASRGASPVVVTAMVEMAQAQWDGVYPLGVAGGATSFRRWVRTVLEPAVDQ